MQKIASVLFVLVLVLKIVACTITPTPTSPLPSPLPVPDPQPAQNRLFKGDVMNYQDAAIGGVSLFLLILGIVEAAKQFGVTGKGSLLLSIVLGGALFGLFKAGDGGLIPANVLPWLEVVVYGLGGGLAVSGLYDFVEARLPKQS